MNKYLVEKGDLLFNRTNSRDLVGKTAVFDNDGKYVFASYIIRVKLNRSKVIPKFISYFLNSKRGKDILYNIARPAIQMANINAEEFRSIQIPLPFKNGTLDLEEQKRIVSRIETLFEKLDKARELRLQAKKEAEELLKSALHQVFSKADEKGWKRMKLKELGKYINGRAFSPNEWEDRGLPIIRIQNLNDPTAPYNYYSKPVEEKYYVKNGDLLISWSATLDVYVWEGGDALLNQHIFKVKLNTNKVTKDFMYYVVKYALNEIKGKTHSSTMKHITKSKFENFKIPIPFKDGKPDIEEQKCIAAYLDQIAGKQQKLLKLYKETEKEIDEMKQSILNKAFRGEL